ncbi:MAG: FtsX-like permease family protein [Acidobacteriota bacterium]
MTRAALIAASLRHYRGLHALVVVGVAVAVSVLGGALLVGSSVRQSLRDLALDRLGATELVLTSTTFFRAALADDVRGDDVADVVPIVAVSGAVTHESSRRTAARVHVFGIDERFLAFHGRDPRGLDEQDAWISPGMAAELSARDGDDLVLRLATPTDIPLSHVQGRREDRGRRLRLVTTRIVPRAELGEFSLVPSQGPALSVFVPLARLQRELNVTSQANVLLIRMAAPGDAAGDIGRVKRLVAAAARLEDVGLRVRTDAVRSRSILESRSALIPEAVARGATDLTRRSGQDVVGALAYLANSIRAANGREIPYSLVAGLDLVAYARLSESSAPPSASMQAGSGPPRNEAPPIHLNEWAAAELGVGLGDKVEIDYYLWSDREGLTEQSATFTLAGVVPMSGAGGDATLTPEYPGVTDAADLAAWDPPFPVDLARIRPQDEAYWDRWRTAPKAFVPLETGQGLWPSPFGNLSSLRIGTVTEGWPTTSAIDVFAAGLAVRHARAEALAAADGTTDFGEYFIYFSFFLVVAGLLLAGLFFALGVEQRARELGVLAALGVPSRTIRGTLLTEAGVLAGVGSLIGVAGAIGYAAAIMYGLRTWWVGAVGTTALVLHVRPALLTLGVAGALVAAVVALAWSFRRVTRQSARTLLTAGAAPDQSRTSRLPGYLAVRAPIVALVLVAAALSGLLNQVAAFFGAGGLLLIAGCAAFAVWLQPERGDGRARPALWRFGASYARWRPTRSVLSAALIAFASFVIVAVGAFRRDAAGISLAPESGTGGFALMAESIAPLMHNPNTPGGRAELGLPADPLLERMRVTRLRLKPGDEASCLTLYQPTNPRIVAPEASFGADRRFSFARSMAETDEERENPWRLLDRRFPDDAIPAIADLTSLTYVFHLAVGDEFVFTPEGGAPVTLRIVGALADSVLQSELIIGESAFTRLFPQHEGYRVWLIEAAEADREGLTALLEDRLIDAGLDVSDTRARLASYHQVENTYLSTFQALGALGLLLGTFGLAAVLARNVLERRRELAVLSAVGFTPRNLRTLVSAESLLLVLVGLAVGTLAALVAIAPALVGRAESLSLPGLVLLLVAVLVTGLASSLAAIRLTTSARLLDAISSE